MKTPKRIQRRRTKGYRLPEGAVYVGRPTIWGNPFKVVGVGGRWTVVDDNGRDYRENPCGWVCKDDAARKACRLFRIRMEIERDEIPIYELRGKDLACWCPLDAPCHADVLLCLANLAGKS